MKKLNKSQIHDLYEKCIKLLQRKPPEFLIFQKLKNLCGVCVYEDDLIILDPRRDLIKTAYHECVHYIHPEWSESQVLYAESRLMNVISNLETARFLKILSSKIYKAELIKNLEGRKNFDVSKLKNNK